MKAHTHRSHQRKENEYMQDSYGHGKGRIESFPAVGWLHDCCSPGDRHRRFKEARLSGYLFLISVSLSWVAVLLLLGQITRSDRTELTMYRLRQNETRQSFSSQQMKLAFDNLDSLWRQEESWDDCITLLSSMPDWFQKKYVGQRLVTPFPYRKMDERVALLVDRIDPQGARALIEGVLLSDSGIEVKRQVMNVAAFSKDPWYTELLVDIARDTQQCSFIRRKALKVTGLSSYSNETLIECFLRDEDVVLREMSGRHLFALAENNDDLKAELFGQLKVSDLEWIEKEENPVLSKSDIFKVVTKIAGRHGLEAELVLAVIKAESNFRADCVSRAGAQGLMQLMPATARSVGVDNPFDIRENISGGVKYLSKMMERFEQNLVLALAAYNAGPGTVARYKGVPPYKETRNYIKKVTQYLGEYRNEGVRAL